MKTNENVNIYKVLNEYDGCYCVTNDGEIVNCGFKKPRKIKGSADAEGYIQVCLKKEGKLYYPLLHRLVANAFLSNPKKLTQLHHIDGDTNNNSVDNLMYVTPSEHKLLHLSEHEVVHEEQFAPKVIELIDEDDNVINRFSTETNAAEWLKRQGYDNALQSGVSKACRGIKKTYYGYRFRFA